MWALYLNWLHSLTKSWIAFTAVFLATLVALTALTYWIVATAEHFLVRRGHWPSHFSLVGKFFLATEAFFWSMTLLFLPSFVTMPAEISSIVYACGRSGMIVALAALLMKATDVTAGAYLRSLELTKDDNLRERRIATKLRYVEKMADVLIIVVALALFLLGFERFRRIGGSLLASAGLASLIVGFAAQKSLGTLIAGLQVAFTQPIRIGDAVLVENEWGEIEEINLTYVVVRIWDLRRLVVPITYFLEKPFQNWTRTSSDLVGVVLLNLDFSVPVDAIRTELTRLLRESKLWDGKVNVVQVTDTTERSMVVRVLVSARSSGKAFDLRCEVREKLVAFLRERYPESLPRVRLDVPSPAQAAARTA